MHAASLEIQRYASAHGARYMVKYRTPHGKQTSKRGFATRREAQAFAETIEVNKRQDIYVHPADGRISLEALAGSWLAGKETTLKPSSYARDEGILRLYVLPKWGSYALTDIQHSDVQWWANSLTKQCSVSSTRKAYHVLSSILKTAAQDRLTPMTPAQDIQLPKTSSMERQRFLTPREVEMLAKAAGEQHELVVYVLSYCGLWWGEMGCA